MSSPENALVPLAETARQYLRQAKSDNTRRAYRADWSHFQAWCAAHELAPLLAREETLVLYFSELAATHKVSTLQRRLAAISQAHQVAGFETPTRGPVIRNLLAGIRRAKGTASAVKTPALTEDIRLMVRAMPDSLLGCRDRAVLLIGFAGAFRRSELVSLDVEDLAFEREGVIVMLRRSKTDTVGQGRKIGIPLGSGKTCPVRALERWMEVAEINTGLIVKRWVQAVGLDPAEYAGHSLRSGLATSAARNGASERSIMNQTGHRSVQMVRRYIREGTVFDGENAAGKAGL
jgi:site-specific recombinase XerD